ncbi:Variant surface glycoprotein [Trypanosoma congolense IL3000]|uniref:Variant surface glycoprotein n=1 Tax=Trypanosoma congolense (strain IL3000) TaxID=1068625 RepID=F9WC83_TRYCI|nr:Variant surface glycoprotein [Trypanosoma congolense IL3000]
MVIGIWADEVEEIVLDDNDFELLCNVSKSMTGLLYTVAEVPQVSNEISEIERELSDKIDEIFFGLEQSGVYSGYSFLPKKFKNTHPNRKEVCGSNKKSKEMPSASESLASAIFCLCMGTTGRDEDLCKTPAQSRRSWPYGTKIRMVQNEFETVWDNVVINQCIGHGGASLEKEKQNLADNVTKIKEKLEMTEKLATKKTSCDESNACAKVTKNPTWLENLREIENITNRTLVLLEEQKKRLESIRPKPETPLPSDSVSEVTSETEPDPLNAQVKAPVPEENRRQEQRKAPEAKQKLEPKVEQQTEKTPMEVYQTKAKKEEDSIQAPETNKTSGPFMTSPMIFHLATLLI